MTRMGSRAMVRGFAIAAGVVLAGFGTLYALGGHTARVKQKLAATSAAPSAKGNAKLIVHGSKKGKFGVTAVHLQGGKQFDVVVGGVKVGQMTTNSGGTGTVHFSTTPGGTTALLGFDPRGSMVVVRDDDTGDDDLVGNMPPGDGTETACCLPEGDNSQGDEQGGSQGNKPGRRDENGDEQWNQIKDRQAAVGDKHLVDESCGAKGRDDRQRRGQVRPSPEPREVNPG